MQATGSRKTEGETATGPAGMSPSPGSTQRGALQWLGHPPEEGTQSSGSQNANGPRSQEVDTRLVARPPSLPRQEVIAVFLRVPWFSQPHEAHVPQSVTGRLRAVATVHPRKRSCVRLMETPRPSGGARPGRGARRWFRVVIAGAPARWEAARSPPSPRRAERFLKSGKNRVEFSQLR